MEPKTSGGGTTNLVTHIRRHHPSLLTPTASQPTKRPKPTNDLIPYRVVDSPNLRGVIAAMDPRYHYPPRKQFSEMTIPNLYNITKVSVKEALQQAEQRRIFQVLRDCVAEWNIPTSQGFPKVVTDNAAIVTQAVQLTESTFHMPCLAHTINLAVQKSLKVKHVSHLLSRVRRIVAFFHRIATGNKLLQTKAELLGLPNHKLFIDVIIRWNSAYGNDIEVH